MTEEACCTCAKLLSAISPLYDEKTEKPFTYDRQLECCGRFICGVCIAKNPRFAVYCPFCQISTAPNPFNLRRGRWRGVSPRGHRMGGLARAERDDESRSPHSLIHVGFSASPKISQGLRDPPAYSPPSSPNANSANYSPSNVDELPTYSSLDFDGPKKNEKYDNLTKEPAEDVLHFLDSAQDTISSLSLRYGVPQDVLRRTNGLFADHLLLARRTILIPGEFYKGGVSLSPQPVEGEEEEIRKAKIRRWMVACKVAEYNVALLYLEQSKYDLDAAVETYLADEKWEREHPMASLSKGKSKQKAGRWKFGPTTGLTGQL